MYGHMNRHNKTDKVAAAPPLASKRLLNQVRERIRHLHYSPKTKKADLYWAWFFGSSASDPGTSGTTALGL